VLREFRWKESTEAGSVAWGRRVEGRRHLGSLDQFEVGQRSNVTVFEIGKEFAGLVKRHHFSSNRGPLARQLACRTTRPGSIGMLHDPGRVMPGKRDGPDTWATLSATKPHNLRIARIDAGTPSCFWSGARCPGARGRQRDRWRPPSVKA